MLLISSWLFNRDFNLEFIKCLGEDFRGRGKSVAGDKNQASKFLDLCDCFNLRNICLKPRRGNNVLDLLCTNSEFIKYKQTYINGNLSDHNLVELCFDI